MKSLLSAILIVSLLSSTAYSECVLSEDIKKVPTGYLYSTDCHKLVGQKFIENKELKEQRERYENLLKLKDDSLLIERERAELWYRTSQRLEKRVSTIEYWQKKNEYIYLGAGILLTIGAGWALGQASK